MAEIKCNRCGLCCFMLTSDGGITSIPCKRLIFLEDGTTKCPIYQRRNRKKGLKLSNNNYCGTREMFPFNIPGCPYNKPEWGESYFVEDKENE